MAGIRLTPEQVRVIKEAAIKAFGEGTRVILFGSRVDPEKRGGDIDLYIIPAVRDNIYDRRLEFLVELKLRLGDRKIDVVVQRDPTREIERVALETGVEL